MDLALAHHLEPVAHRGQRLAQRVLPSWCSAAA